MRAILVEPKCLAHRLLHGSWSPTLPTNAPELARARPTESGLLIRADSRSDQGTARIVALEEFGQPEAPAASGLTERDRARRYAVDGDSRAGASLLTRLLNVLSDRA
jgi:hypothetical protein